MTNPPPTEQTGLEFESSVRPSAPTDEADSVNSQESKPQAAINASPAPSRPTPLLDHPDATEDAQAKMPSLSQPSHSSSKDTAPGAAPYGTRSRNRTGISRPNYAEDREFDLDLETQAAPLNDSSRKAARSRQSMPHSSVPTSMVRRAEGPDAGTAQSVSKDHIPGTSSFLANPDASAPAQPPKKRKTTALPSSNAVNGNHSTTPTATAPSSNHLPRSNISLHKESFMLAFENCGARPQHGKLVADDGTAIGVNDNVYLICEPPGEPYYLGRIMEFLYVDNDPMNPVDALRMNWYYRPKDIGRKTSDTRQVFASMHSDISPLTSLRGLCQVKHKSEIENMDEYRRAQNCFWYEKLFDRYICRYYEVIPTKQVVNVPGKVKKILDERWKFILVEAGRGKELTSAVKSCKRCHGFCASNNSVDCAVCHQTYHMNCVRPPLLKKPSRGFAWACGPCSRAQERKMEAKNTPITADAHDEEDEAMDEDDKGNTRGSSPMISAEEDSPIHPGTAEQIYQAGLWPFRYLGIHCKVEDALDYDDRIYPRASSRLGPKHQANIPGWPGRPFELVKPPEIKRKHVKGGSHKKDGKAAKEAIAALEADKLAREKRPDWVVDEPRGYVHRGEDYDAGDPNCTAELLFKPPESDQLPENQSRDSIIDNYLERSAEIAKKIGVKGYSTNFLDKAVHLLYSANYDTENALKSLSKVERADLKEPELTPAEIRKFEDGVAKYGSELHSVKKHVKTVSSARIVRFYYIWKKTERGKQIWQNYAGRKGKKEAKKVGANVGRLQDDVADDNDDSAFDNNKALEKKRRFQCKFCSTRTSRQWRRAPNTPSGTTVPADPSNKASNKDKGLQFLVALCFSCAIVWRKYAVQWEDAEEHGKKALQNGGRSNKRKTEDPMREFQLNELSWTANDPDFASRSLSEIPARDESVSAYSQEVPRKKVRSHIEREQVDAAQSEGDSVVTPQQKKKTPEKPSASASVPEVPKPKILPCSVCLQMEPMDELFSCKECRMTVHRNCYGIASDVRRNYNNWICDMCTNDRNPQVSIQYKCMLCPIEATPHDFVEPAKPTHKKRGEKEKEKDRIERELAIKAEDYYRKKQADMNRPIIPREPLKRTANNNWVHVTCAVWTPEVKFGNARALEPSEGIPSIPSARYEETCKACRSHNGGACIACLCCRAPVHVECAHQAGYILGFDVSPPAKGTRRDQVRTVNCNGDNGVMAPAVWCKEHLPTKTIPHQMHDIMHSSGWNALQLYVRVYKQADLTLTGTVRKATLVNQSTKAVNPSSSITASNRRVSAAGVGSTASRGSASNVKTEATSSPGVSELSKNPANLPQLANVCVTCGIDTSPKWWPFLTQPNGGPAPVKRHLESHSADDGPDLSSNQKNETTLSSNPKKQVALAVAALSENMNNGSAHIEVQCHKCHWNKVQKPLRSPPMPAPVSRQEVVQPRQSTLASTAFAGSTSSPLAPQGAVQQPASQYPWTHSNYPQSPAYADWPRMSPVPHNPNIGLSQSPRQLQAINPHVNSQTRPPFPTIAPSPHMNGSMPPATPSNGFSPSPRHHASFASYGSARAPPPPQHLMNGGPPPHASEEPFMQGNQPTLPRPFGISHSSPPVHRDGFQGGRDPNNHSASGGIGRLPEHRVNGGASASPSLQNLLS